jgi:hypothetical protein
MSDSSLPRAESVSGGSTRYGFDWGPMSVERLCHIDGRGYVLTIRTEHQEMQVHVTEAGRKIKPYPTRPRVARRER